MRDWASSLSPDMLPAESHMLYHGPDATRSHPAANIWSAETQAALIQQQENAKDCAVP